MGRVGEQGRLDLDQETIVNGDPFMACIEGLRVGVCGEATKADLNARLEILQEKLERYLVEHIPPPG